MRLSSGILLLATSALAYGAGLASPAASLSYDPGLNAQGRGQGQEPNSRRSQPARRSAGRQVTAPNPVDPNGEASARVVTEVVDDHQLALWFRGCDVNDNQWLSYFETKRTLLFSKDLFQSYDRDRDGRINRKEFDQYYDYTSGKGLFKRPRRLTKPTPPERDANQLLIAYDSDLNGSISRAEAARFLRDYSSVDLDVETLFPRADRDESNALDQDEIETLSIVVRRLNAPSSGDTGPAPNVTLDTLFLQVVKSPTRSAPDRIEGPVTPFRRLDFDGNGVISKEDLSALQLSALRGLRPSTILHTLDKNQDGVLSRDEFLESLESGPK